MQLSTVTVATVATLLVGVVADLPVHCVHRDIIGKWQLRLAHNDGDASLTCGHHVPDRILTMVKNYAGPANPPFKISRVLDVELRNPNIAVGPGGSVGTWTAVYDEGFEVILDGWRYLTFFRYTPKHAGADPSKSEDFNWLCHETVPGWYHPVQHVPADAHSPEQRFIAAETGWGCFVGEQSARAVPADAAEAIAAARALEQSVTGPAVLSATVRSLRFAGVDEHVQAASSGALLTAGEGAFLESQSRNAAGRAASRRTAAAAPPLVLADLASTTQVSSHDVLEALHASDGAAAADLVRRINAEGSLWTARVPSELLGASKEELRARLGASSSGKVRVPSHSRGAAAARGLHSDDSGNREVRGADTGSGPHEDAPLEALVGGHRPVIVDVSGLPPELDWATADGGIYMPPVVDQRSCGSCYAVAAIDAVTFRARIRSPALARAGFRLSPESVVRCSIFNQGCEGGYPYLVGKSAAEVGIIEEACMPYTGSQATCPVNVSCTRFGNVQAWGEIQRGRSPALRTPSTKLGLHAATPGAATLLEVANRASAAAAVPQGSIDADAFSTGAESDLFSGDAAADAALTAAFGGVGPLGIDRSSPHFREGVPKVHEHAHNDAAMVANPFVSATGRLRVTRYEYVGGYYGACHETSMLVELQKGPIIVAFNSPGTLYMYKSGIFTHSMAPDVASVDVTPISRWEKTNHAVLLVGYGVEDGIKYWKLRNSWGSRFGEGGYFRMVRGVDMLACESMAVVIDV